MLFDTDIIYVSNTLLKGEDIMEKHVNIVKEEILNKGRVTAEIKKKYFADSGFGALRNWLEENGLDRHFPLELESTEIAIKTPFGILMQIRPSDKDQLGVWGGVLEKDETPAQGAVRELREETGLIVNEEQLEFIEVNEHFHEYANHDKAYFKSYRYVLNLDYVPEITTDEESVGVFMVTHTILSHQQKFIKKVLGEEE